MAKTIGIADTTKQKVEHIKDDAKKYYKWKNMIYRYVLIWFLLILLILQFLLPNNKAGEDQNISWELKLPFEATWVVVDFPFLGNLVNLNNSQYDNVYTDIISNKLALELLYKKSLSFLSDLKEQLEDEDIPTDFQYLSLINGLNDPVWILPPEAIEDYDLIIDEDIDETLNIKKSTDVTIEHLKELYDEFKAWDLVLVAYMLWADDIEKILENQNKTEFSEIYLEKYAMSWYYEVIAYKYVMENISDYINTKNITAYPQADTKIIKLWETKDIVERADKVWYTFKEIKELNTWILWDALPKWKWELEVYVD